MGRAAIDKAAICLGRTALDKGNLPRPRRVFANADLGSIVNMSVDNPYSTIYHHYMPDHLQNNAPVGILLLFNYTPHLASLLQAPVCRSVESRSGPEYILLLIKELLFYCFHPQYYHSDTYPTI